jgi:hypothetical protein
VPQQPILAVLGAERLLEQRVVTEVDHPRAKVVASSPVGIDLVELFGV